MLIVIHPYGYTESNIDFLNEKLANGYKVKFITAVTDKIHHYIIEKESPHE